MRKQTWHSWNRRPASARNSRYGSFPDGAGKQELSPRPEAALPLFRFGFRRRVRFREWFLLGIGLVICRLLAAGYEDAAQIDLGGVSIGGELMKGYYIMLIVARSEINDSLNLRLS